MKKLVLAAIALASVTALLGASAAPAAPAAAPAAAPGSAPAAAPGSAPAPDDRVVYILRWRLTEIASHNVGRNGFVTADRIRSLRTGKIVGYDSVSGKFDPQTGRARIDVAASLKGGILIARVHANFQSGDEVFHGPVLKGTGRFLGAEGTITARPIGDGTRTRVKVRYHL